MIRDIRLTPSPSDWHFSNCADDSSPCLASTRGHWARQTRNELLHSEPTGPVAATGHQAGFFHPGVLAKYHALDALGGRGAILVELVVDQDVNDPLEVPCPMVDSAGRPVAGVLRLAPPDRPETPTASRPSRIIAEPALDSVWPDVRGRAHTMIAALNRFAESESLAAQSAFAAAGRRGLHIESHVQAGVYRLSRDGEPSSARTLLHVSALSRTTAWAQLCAHIAASTSQMREAYNRAAAVYPGAGIRPLADSEIPLWILETGKPRRPAFEADLHGDPTDLLPRALLMTAFMRLFVCDLFIHGTGGYDYDRITEQWIRQWLGLTLAPMACVTATVTLDGAGLRVSRDDLRRAQWRLHHLPYNLEEALNDESERCWKRDLLARIETVPRRSTERRRLFQALRARQHDLQQRHHDHLDHVRADLIQVESALDAQRVLDARDWPFPLHDPADLAELARRVQEAFSQSAAAMPR